MKALKLVWSGVRFIGLAAWGLLTLASPKADDEANGVDLGGQGRVSWRQSSPEMLSAFVEKHTKIVQGSRRFLPKNTEGK